MEKHLILLFYGINMRKNIWKKNCQTLHESKAWNERLSPNNSIIHPLDESKAWNEHLSVNNSIIHPQVITWFIYIYIYSWEREKEKSTLTTFNYQVIALMFLNFHFVQRKLILKLQRFLLFKKMAKLLMTKKFRKNEKGKKRKAINLEK